MSNEKKELLDRLYTAQSKLALHLHLFGDHLAVREGYHDLDGIEAVQFYLIQKHSWLPRDVKAMSHEELRFVLNEEIANWTLPEEFRD